MPKVQPPIPPVQYTRTPDGASIAFLVAGEGRTIVLLPFHHSHLELRWTRLFWERGLAANNRVIAYDSRGQGLSSRGLDRGPSLEDYRLDLEAVIQATGIRTSVLVSYGGFAHVALRYAVDYPEFVDALVLICTCESFSAWPLGGMLALAQENWDLFLQLELAGWPPEDRDEAAAFISASASSGDYIHLIKAFASSNVTDILDRVRAPVLILHSLNQHWLSMEEGTKLAARIDGARLVFLDGDLQPNDVEGVRAINDFLDDVCGEDICRELPIAPSDARSDVELSARQAEVLRLVASGSTTREIAEQLVLSERTVERHISDVYAKLGLRNRAEATAYVLGRLKGT